MISRRRRRLKGHAALVPDAITAEREREEPGGREGGAEVLVLVFDAVRGHEVTVTVTENTGGIGPTRP
jgi:hypothetical protein